MTLAFDRPYREEGYRLLCGVDEAGRGPLAGPVVAAAVIMPEKGRINNIDDSKKVREPQRELLAGRIRERALAWAVGVASVEEIGRLNILQATFLAMRRAVGGLERRPDYLLVDGRDFPAFVHPGSERPLPGDAVVRGDARSYSIACASILAKVHRDGLMREWAARYPQYGFERHKGYAAAHHIAMLRKHGPCPIHRRQFIRNFIPGEGRGQQELF